MRTFAAVAIVVAVGSYTGWVIWAMENLAYEDWAPIVVAPLLLVISVPLLHRIASTGGNRPSLGLLVSALIVKLTAALLFVKITDQAYDGVADYSFYHKAGAVLAESYRSGRWDVHVDSVPGFGSIQIVTGAIYRVTGTSLQVGFLVFSWLAFWGLVMVVVAIRTALPSADLRRASVLVLLLPSTVFWASSLGKDSWMVLAIGLCALGVARFVVYRRGGLPVAVLGIAAAGFVRPHVALMLFVALILTFLARRSRSQALGPITKLVGAVLLAAVGLVLVRYATDFLQIEDLSPAGVNDALDRASTSSAGGSASIDPHVGGTLARLPWAVVTVLFRPFLWEVHNAQALATALECTALAYLAWSSRRGLSQLPRLVRREPYLLFVLVYSLLFTLAFSSFANLGTLARERVQLFPLLVVVLCLPLSDRHEERPVRRERIWTGEPARRGSS